MNEHTKKLQHMFDKEPPLDEELLHYALALRDAGWSQRDLYDLYAEFLLTVSEQDSKNADALRDGLDLIVGWCSPPVALYSTYLQT